MKKTDDEIDLLELGTVIWSKRIFVFKVGCVFVLLGLIIAFTSKIEYEATCKLMPESQEGIQPDLGGLGSLAGIAGINLNLGSSGSMSPLLYPEIMKSAPFLNELLLTPLYFERLDTTVTSYQYFKEIDSPSLIGLAKSYTLGLPGKIKSLFSTPSDSVKQYGMLRFTKEDWELVEAYSSRLSISIDDETGIITIVTEMPDAVASAALASLLVEQLTNSVTEYKIEKAKSNLDFVKVQFEEAKEEYQQKQERVARFTDRNRNISNPIIQTEYERLQNEMNISFEVYKALASKLEQAKIKVKEETPVFTVLEPVKIPVDKSKPKRLLILIGMGAFSLTVSISIILFKFLTGK